MATIDQNFESHLISLAVSELRTLSDAPDMFAISSQYQDKIASEAPFKDIAQKQLRFCQMQALLNMRVIKLSHPGKISLNAHQ